MTVRPTVMPAIMSETNHSKLYLGSQVRIGIRLFTFFTKNKNSLSPCQTNLLENRLDKTHQFSYSTSNPHWRVWVCE